MPYFDKILVSTSQNRSSKHGEIWDGLRNSQTWASISHQSVRDQYKLIFISLCFMLSHFTWCYSTFQNIQYLHLIPEIILIFVFKNTIKQSYVQILIFIVHMNACSWNCKRNTSKWKINNCKYWWKMFKWAKLKLIRILL